MSERHNAYRYYANGKLLITGEYLVMMGVRALAVPLKLGQWMDVISTPGKKPDFLRWNARSNGKTWFEATFSISDLSLVETTSAETAERLRQLLLAAGQLKEGFFSPGVSFEIKTDTSFDINWGMGSSSTLIVLIASWAGVDAYRLFEMTSKGSGYDIACALADTPIIFQRTGNKPVVTPVDFNPPCKDNIYFFYQGKKQDSSRSIVQFISAANIDEKHLEEINLVTDRILVAESTDEMADCIRIHERIMSEILQCPGIKESRFNDFEGEMKSLGAWGGDFAMAVTDRPADAVLGYFHSHGINTVFRFPELVYSRNSKTIAHG
jgi:mevalonate kinase